ncbi:tyrosine-type recombinase/integrase [Streptosporangium sp. NPDC006930]|uniref:tyrosine-type recombinase/integrase n=1 Tax=unclassified Streptosporangium TaxID=2632669 RepID=UPI00343F2586
MAVKRARVPKPGALDALSRAQENPTRRTADRRSPRDAALIALLLGAGARAEECQRLHVGDAPITARSSTARLHGKGDEVRTVPLPIPARERLTAWLQVRAELLAARPALANAVGEGLWAVQRGRLTVNGVTDVVRAVGKDAFPEVPPARLTAPMRANPENPPKRPHEGTAPGEQRPGPAVRRTAHDRPPVTAPPGPRRAGRRGTQRGRGRRLGPHHPGHLVC